MLLLLSTRSFVEAKPLLICLTIEFGMQQKHQNCLLYGIAFVANKEFFTHGSMKRQMKTVLQLH